MKKLLLTSFCLLVFGRTPTSNAADKVRQGLSPLCEDYLDRNSGNLENITLEDLIENENDANMFTNANGEGLSNAALIQVLATQWITGKTGRMDLVLKGAVQLVEMHHQGLAEQSEVSEYLSNNILTIFNASMEYETGELTFYSVLEWLEANASIEDIGRLYKSYKQATPKEHLTGFNGPKYGFLSSVESLIFRLSHRFKVSSLKEPLTKEKHSSLRAFNLLNEKYGKFSEDPTVEKNQIDYQSAYSFDGQLSGYWNQALENNKMLVKAEILNIDPLKWEHDQIFVEIITNIRSLSLYPKSPVKLDSDKDTPALMYLDLLAKMSSHKPIGLDEEARDLLIGFFDNDLIHPEPKQFFSEYESEYLYITTLVSAWDIVLSEIFARQGKDWIPSSDDFLPISVGADPLVFELLLKTSSNAQVRQFSKKVLSQGH